MGFDIVNLGDGFFIVYKIVLIILFLYFFKCVFLIERVCLCLIFLGFCIGNRNDLVGGVEKRGEV